MKARHAAGLSLLEMLVVLVIAGMALLLTTQAIGQYQRAQASVLYSERAGREYRLSETWWRQSVRELMAPEEGSLEGDADAFLGTTLAPVAAPRGIPVVQQWQVAFAEDGGWALAVTEAGTEHVLVFRQAGRPRFRYLDAEGEFHDRWPPAAGEHAALPEAIAIDWEGSDDGRPPPYLLAHVAGARRPWYNPYEREVDL